MHFAWIEVINNCLCNARQIKCILLSGSNGESVFGLWIFHINLTKNGNSKVMISSWSPDRRLIAAAAAAVDEFGGRPAGFLVRPHCLSVHLPVHLSERSR